MVQITSSPTRKGSYIQRFSPEEMVRVFELREVLEDLAARRASQNISEGQAGKLQTFFQGLKISAGRRMWRVMELNDYKKKMRQLEAKAKDLKDEAKAEAKRGMDEVNKDIKVAEQKLKTMKSAGAEAWEKVKSDVDSAMASVKEGYEKVAAQFKG